MISFTIISTKRSGSTLLRTLLNATQMVYIPKESHIFSINNMFKLDFNVFKVRVIKKIDWILVNIVIWKSWRILRLLF